MDRQNRLTRIEEWKVGDFYVWHKFKTIYPARMCVEVNAKEGWVRFDSGSDDVLKFYNWQKRFIHVVPGDDASRSQSLAHTG